MRRRKGPAPDGDLLAGTLDMLILRILKGGSVHGLDIAQRIERQSDQVLLVEQGSLYPALHRLEERGWISAAWGTTENNRRARYYSLTTAGRKQLQAEANRWKALVNAVARVMKTAES